VYALINRSYENTVVRICDLLYMYCSESQNTGSNTLHISQIILRGIIGASHAQIERALRYLREKGIISTSKTEIIVLSTDLLLEECSETLKLTDRSAF